MTFSLDGKTIKCGLKKIGSMVGANREQRAAIFTSTPAAPVTVNGREVAMVSR